jgi:hypothetical protein
MKDYLNNFFNKATDEDGNKISRVREDGFAGEIWFTEDNYIDVTIKIDDVTVHDSYLDSNQEYMYDAFVEYVQQEMRDAESSYRDQEETKHTLLYDN